MGGKPRPRHVFDAAQIRQVQYGKLGRSYPCAIARCVGEHLGFGLKAGDLLLVHEYPHDYSKLTVVCRIGDNFDPRCNVYRSQVVIVESKSGMRTQDIGVEPPQPCWRRSDYD